MTMANYGGEQRANISGQFCGLYGVSMADAANPLQAIQRLRARVAELERFFLEPSEQMIAAGAKVIESYEPYGIATDEAQLRAKEVFDAMSGRGSKR
jgi:hypothetical protein